MSIEGQQDIIIPSSDHDRKAMISEIQAICDEWTMIESRRAVIKDIVANTAEAFNLSKDAVTQLARMHYKRNKEEVQAKTDAMCEAYDQLFNPTGAA